MKRNCQDRAFTILELIFVMGIIILLVGVTSSLLVGGVGGGSNLVAAEGQITRILDNARAVALARAENARVLVADDSADEEQRLRRFLVIVELPDPDPATGDAVWELVGAPFTLPKSIYVQTDAIQPPTGPILVPSITFDASTGMEGAGTNWLSYDFSADGTSAIPGARLVVAAGILDQATGQLTVPNDKRRVGVVLRRNGRATRFRSPDQI